MTNRPSPIGYLSSQNYIRDFDQWAEKNIKRYSRRAFAQWAKIASSNFITLIVSNKRPLQLGWLDGFSKAASLDKREWNYLKTLIRFEQCKRSQEKEELHSELKKQIFSTKISSLKESELYLLSSPDTWALYVALAFRPQEKDAALTLKKLLPYIEMARIRKELKNFQELGLVVRDESEKLAPKHPFISTDNEYSRIENKKFHGAVLQEATAKLDQLKSEERSYGSLTILVNPNEFLQLKRDVQNFGAALLAKYGEASREENKHLAVRLNLQLYPLTGAK